VTIAALSSCAPDASGSDAPDLPALLRTGSQAASARRWGACIDALSAAAAIDNAPKTWGELGLCEEQAGRFVAAHDHLFRAVEAAPTVERKEPWTRYQAALARVKERVAVVIVTASPPNAKVVLDGRPLGAADGRAFAVEPGKHTIGARLAGYVDKVETRTMRAHDVPTFDFQLAKADAAPMPASSATAPPDARTVQPPSVPRPSRSGLFVPGWSPRGVLVGLTYAGAAAVVVSGGTWIGLEVDRVSLRGRVPGDACGSSPSAPASPAICSALSERRQQRDTAADLTMGLGIATGAVAFASAIAITLEWRASRAVVAPVVHDRGGGLVLGGVW
jgi:hypothetical protein